MLKRRDDRYSSLDSDSDSEWKESARITDSGIFTRSNSNKHKIQLAEWFL